MSTTTKDLRDDEEEDDEEEAEGEGEGEESEDEDFVPNAADFDEDSDGDEGAYDDSVPEVGAAPEKVGKRKKPAGPAKAKGAAKKKRGGIVLEEDEVAAAAAKEQEPTFEEDGAADGAAADGAAADGAAAGGPKKGGVDDLWASMNEDSKSSKRPAASSGLDIKALLAKTGAGAATSGGVSSGGGGGGRMVEIQQKMDFCGEEVVVTKKVKEGSQEELAFRQGDINKTVDAASSSGGGAAAKKSAVSSALAASAQLRTQMLGGSGRAAGSSTGGLRTDASLEFKGGLGALPVGATQPKGAAKASGLQGLLAELGGKKKMSTMEKSRFDWGKKKSTMDEQDRDEMERYAKDGYLAKQEFLARTDQRQAEVARNNRRRGMGMKD